MCALMQHTANADANLRLDAIKRTPWPFEAHLQGFLERWLCKGGEAVGVCVMVGHKWESERREAQGSEVIMSGVIRPASRLAKAYIMVLMMARRSTGESLCVRESVSLCVVNLSFHYKVKGESWKVPAVWETCSCQVSDSIWWKLYDRCSVECVSLART